MLIRKSNDRGHSKFKGLISFHSFSFGDYIDLNHRGFGSLRVINEDEILPEIGFDTHPHWNMEIITYVYEGTLSHADSMGYKTEIRTGEVQKISAGTGIEHSEYNHSKTEAVKLLQIWIVPKSKNTSPNYEQQALDPNAKIQLIASGDSQDKSLTINQDAKIYLLRLKAGEHYRHELQHNKSWLQIIKGELNFDQLKLSQGDGLGLENQKELNFLAQKDSELLIFEL